MSKTEDFITKFHAIQGITLSERRRNFNQLLDQLRSDLTSEEDLNSFITALTPRTPLEEDYKLDILLGFNRNEDLLQILKAGNPLHIRKVLNTWNFFHVRFQTISEDALINDVFPHTSFCTRMKILNRLYKNLRNEEKADVYFKAVEEKYGLKVASAILPGCSLELIKATLQEYKLKLTSRHLLSIVKRDPKFLEFYYELLGGTFSFSEHYKQVLKYIAKTDVEYYWELFNKHELRVKLGRHMTPYVLRANMDVLKQDKIAPNYFNHRKMLAVLKSDGRLFEEFVLARFPKNVGDFNCSFHAIREFLKFASKREQYAVISKCFVETYKKKITDEPGCVPEDLLKIMTVGEREVVLDVRVPDDETLIYLYPPKKSIALLKEKIKHSSEMEKRSKLLTQLVKSCIMYNDSDSLLIVLKYFLFRHKNDLYVLIEFMRKLIAWPNVEKLSAEHWKCMNELLKILSVSGKYSNREFNFMEKYLQYLWENELPYDEHIRAFLKYIAENQYEIHVFYKQEKHMKMCLEHFADLIPQMFEGQKYKSMCQKILQAIMKYNTNGKDPIFITRYVEIIDTVKQMQETNSINVNNYIVKFAYEKAGIYDAFFWDHYKEQHTCSMVIWYIKTNPLKVLENIEKIFVDLPSSSQCRNLGYRWWQKQHLQNCLLDEILKLLARFSHLNIPEKLLHFALATLQTGKTNYAAKILSHLGTPAQYSNAFDSCNEDTRKTLARNLRNLNPPYTIIPLLLKFCTPKYITATQQSLYHIISNTPEIMLVDFFATLYKSSASVKKHAINLTIAMSTKEGIYNFLKQAGAQETAPSLKKIIFKLTMKYFVQNPSDLFWDLLESNIDLIDPKDREAHDFLLNLNKIPHDYRSRYIPLIYSLLSKSTDRIINKKKYDLLHHIPNNLVTDLDLDVAFTSKAITDALFNRDLPTTIEEWVGLKFVFYTKKEHRSTMLRAASNALKNYVGANWDGPARITVSNYLKQFCQKFIELQLELELLSEFRAVWLDTFEREDVFEECLLLDLTSAYVDCSSENKLTEFGVKANEILGGLVEVYDGSVVDLFAGGLRQFLGEFARVMGDEVEMGKFFESFCAANRSPYAFLVVMMISAEIGHIHGAAVLKMIQECKMPAVKVYFEHYAATAVNTSFLFV